MLDLIERKREDLDHLTVAMAQGYGISMSAEYASKWQAEHAPVASGTVAAQRQSAAFGRLAAMFPGAVKVTRQAD
jgi:hypothetical protein